MIARTLALAGLAACMPGPDVGGLATPVDGPGFDGSAGCDADSDPGTRVSFATDIAGGVFVRGRCTTCHTGGGEGVQQSGLSLASYADLRNGGRHSGDGIVVGGMPCESVLFQKVGPTPPFGRRMPYNGPPYLSAHDVTLVHDWIAEGALDD